LLRIAKSVVNPVVNVVTPLVRQIAEKRGIARIIMFGGAGLLPESGRTIE
jgi:hypothetical protein